MEKTKRLYGKKKDTKTDKLLRAKIQAAISINDSSDD